MLQHKSYLFSSARCSPVLHARGSEEGGDGGRGRGVLVGGRGAGHLVAGGAGHRAHPQPRLAVLRHL